MSVRARARKARERSGKLWTTARGMLRRMVPGNTASGLWQAIGFGSERLSNVEPFSGIGFYARPKRGSRAELIVGRVGGSASHPVILATRDESTRVDLDEDETAIFTSQAIVRITKNGEIEIGSRGGTFKSLATKDDIDALASWGSTHVHPETGAATGAPSTAPPSASGTSKLKAE